MFKTFALGSTPQNPTGFLRYGILVLLMLFACMGFSNAVEIDTPMTFKQYSKGNFTIYQGDALQVLETLERQSVDAVITDPPYASGGVSALTRNALPSSKYSSAKEKTYPEFLGEHRDQRSFAYWSTLWASQCFLACKNGAPFLAFSDWRQLPSTTDYIQAANFSYNGLVAWDKTKSVRPAKGQFRAQCEYIAYGFKGKPNKDANPVYLAGAIRQRIDPKKKLHMTGKPIEVMAHLMKVAPPGGVVLDPFMGSGSTGVAALESGRKFIGIEATEEYFEIAKARLEQV